MKNYKYKHSLGFGLIEVLVALVVLSFGLLGTAALQTKSQQFSRNAYMHTQATILAHDMLERMRSNRAGVDAGHYNLPKATKVDNCFALTGCSLREMAENDMNEWTSDVANKLLAGKSVVCIDSTYDDGTFAAPACDGLGNTYAVKVWWENLKSTTQLVVTIATF